MVLSNLYARVRSPSPSHCVSIAGVLLWGLAILQSSSAYGQAVVGLPTAPSALLESALADLNHDLGTAPPSAQQWPVAGIPGRPETVHRQPEPTGYPAYPTEHQQHVREEIERNTDCEQHVRHGKECRVSWARVLGESFEFLAAQHGGNISMDRDTRYALTHGSFWDDYIYCVDHYRYSRWKDDDPFSIDYIGHPMMGAMTNSIYEQNDPKQRALMFENTKRYWMGRLRATAYSAAYSAQWKVGPISEASIGNTGINYYLRADGVSTNETGMQDFFITPIGGLAWNVGEDAMDRLVFSHILHSQKNRAVLFVASVLTPLKSAANLSRFRAPYYRDYDERTARLIHWKHE